MTNSIAILAKNIRIVDGLYSLNDLHKASGNEDKHRPSLFMANAQTKQLVAEISKAGNPALGNTLAAKSVHGGTGRGTYVCKELVYAYAMWISAKFTLIVINAFDAMNNPVPQTTTNTISDEQAGALYNIVHARAIGNGKLAAELWGRLKKHFGYASYHKLKAHHFDEAKTMLETMDLHGEVKALPAPTQPSYFLSRCQANEFDVRLKSLFDLAGLIAKRGDDIAAVFQKQAHEMNQFLSTAS
jgi:KilA-N domain